MNQAQRELVSPLGLAVVHSLCQEFDRHHIVYCHFKSNEHLLEGMRGVTDLDVLVERGNTQKLTLALSSCGFKRFSAVVGNGYPAVEDYLALDADTGKLVHLHLHYQLVSGEPHLKGFRLPWEQQVLAGRVYLTREKIYTTDPHMEMLLLIVRSALKVRSRDWLFEKLGKRFFGDERLREFHWLTERTESATTLQLATPIFEERAVAALEKLLNTAQPTLRQLRDFRRCANPTLRLYRTYSPLQARLRRSFNELRWLFGGINKRYLHAPLPMRRISASGGLLIALMGCDGSGKSTHIRSVQRWLGWKVDIIPIYFGSGDGPASLLRWPLKLVADALRKSQNYQSSHYKVEIPSTNVDAANAGKRTSSERSSSSMRMLAKALWALVLSLEKRSKLRRATAARNRGIVVICDRYPQNQVMGFNDGPLLSAWQQHSSRLLRALSRWEGVPYSAADMYPPDLVVKLDLTAEVAISRKPEMSLEECNRRIAVIKGLVYPAATQTLLLDATEPLDSVLLKLKESIWSKF